MVRSSRIALACLLTLGLPAQDLAPETEAKFLKNLLSSSGQFGFACSDPALKARLEEAGIAVAPGFKMAWAASEVEARSLKAAGKLVIVPVLGWLKAGGSLAIVAEAGKPQVYLNPANVKASGVTLADTIVKLARKAP